MLQPRPDIERGLRRRRLGLHLGVVAVLAAASLLAAVGAAANPSIDGKRAQARAILAQVQQLDADVGDAAERWNGANYRLGQIDAQLATTTRDLARARDGVKRSQARAATRLRQLYVDGPPAGAVEVLLGATSLQEVMDVLDARQRVTAQDAAIVSDLRTYRARVAEHKAELVRARADQAKVVRERAAEKAAIEAKLAERKRLLASVQAEVRQLVAQEQARQAELRRQAEIRLAQEQRAAAAAAAEARRQAAEKARQDAQAAAAAARATTEQATTTAAPATTDAQTEPAPAPAPAPAPTPAPAPAPAPAPPADAGRAAQVVAIAMRYLGTPYVWGGASPSGFDCSGLTSYVYAQIGISLPHYAAAQYGMGVSVAKSDLQPGDLVFFRNLGHEGLYIGGGQFIHAPHTGDVVKISSLSDPYYVANWVGARRVL